MSIRCLKFTSLVKGALRGFVDFALPSGLVIHDAMILESNGKRWINLPGKPQLDRDKNLKKDDTGKVAYVPVISIPDRDRRDAFNAQALAAIDVFNSSQPPQPAAAAPKSPPAGHPFDDPVPF